MAPAGKAACSDGPPQDPRERRSSAEVPRGWLRRMRVIAGRYGSKACATGICCGTEAGCLVGGADHAPYHAHSRPAGTIPVRPPWLVICVEMMLASASRKPREGVSLGRWGSASRCSFVRQAACGLPELRMQVFETDRQGGVRRLWRMEPG